MRYEVRARDAARRLGRDETEEELGVDLKRLTGELSFEEFAARIPRETLLIEQQQNCCHRSRWHSMPCCASA